MKNYNGKPYKYEPTAEDDLVVEKLAGIQERLGLSDAKFAPDYLTCSTTTWTRIKSGEYWTMVDDGPSVILDREQDLDRAERRVAFRARFDNGRFIATTEAKAVFRGIDACMAKPLSNPERAVFYLAPTRGGKTWITGEAVTRFGAVVVQAREAWTRSYNTCLQDIARACSLTGLGRNIPTAHLERKLVAFFNSKRQVLVIDEGEFFSSSALNLIKYLLNSSTVTILVCAIPSAYDCWSRKYSHEADQVLARTHSVLSLADIMPATALLFLKHLDLVEPEECGAVAAGLANDFGHFSMLSHLANAFTAGQTVDPSAIVQAGNNRRRLWGKPNLAFAKTS